MAKAKNNIATIQMAFVIPEKSVRRMMSINAQIHRPNKNKIINSGGPRLGKKAKFINELGWWLFDSVEGYGLCQLVFEPIENSLGHGNALHLFLISAFVFDADIAMVSMF